MPPKRKMKAAPAPEPEAPKIHPEVQKVLDFEALLEAEEQQQTAARLAKDKIMQRCFEAFGHNLCGPDPIFNASSLALYVEVWLIARELGHDVDENPEVIFDIPNQLEQMHAERDNPLYIAPKNEDSKLGIVTRVHMALRGVAKRLEKQHLWGTFTDLLRMTHRRDAELYRIVYFDLLKDFVDDIVDEDDEEKRKYLYMACSPYPQDHRCPYAIRAVLAEDGWSELTDYSLKRKYYSMYRTELSLDTEDEEKSKNLFKLSAMAFIDVCVPEKWNHFHFLLPDEHYQALAEKLMAEEERKRGFIDLSQKKAKNKNEEKRMAKEKAEKEQMVSMFDSSDTDEDDYFKDDEMDADCRRTDKDRERMNNEVLLDLMRQDETIMESGLLGLSHQELPCYVLWNLARALRITMVGLQPGGCLTVIWGSTPLHATFFWLRHSLQPFFDEVNMLSSPFPSTESLLVCTGFNATVSSVDAFNYFLSRPQRGLGVDDILLWTFGDGYTTLGEMYDRDKREFDDLLADYLTKVLKMERYTIDVEKEKVLQEIERMKEEMREAERLRLLEEEGEEEGEDAESKKKRKTGGSPRRKRGKNGEQDDEKEGEDGKDGKSKKKGNKSKVGRSDSVKIKRGGKQEGFATGDASRELQEGNRRQRVRRTIVMASGLKGSQLERLVRFRNREPDDDAPPEVLHIVSNALDDASPWNNRVTAVGNISADPTSTLPRVSREFIDNISTAVLATMKPAGLQPMRPTEFNPFRNKLRKLIGKREDEAKQSLAAQPKRKALARGADPDSEEEDDDFGELPDDEGTAASPTKKGKDAASHQESVTKHETSMIRMVNKKGGRARESSPGGSRYSPGGTRTSPGGGKYDASSPGRPGYKFKSGGSSHESEYAEFLASLKGPSHTRWERPWRAGDGGKVNPIPADLQSKPSGAYPRPVHLATTLGVSSLDHITNAALREKFEEEVEPGLEFEKRDLVDLISENNLHILRDSGDVNIKQMYNMWRDQYDEWRKKRGLVPKDDQPEK
ncbi:unnamed protein product [Amoebophrya sp. A25]|nr:unnamed protein product [Amoebophrya sp. A25]|eukprot:GSA25T00016087001.1